MALEIRKEDIRQESVNTTPDQFKVIDDVKDEPTLKEAESEDNKADIIAQFKQGKLNQAIN
jgi:hypothetical protein